MMVDSATPQSLVVQHNALVNARFNLNALETRLFLALLMQIERDASSFAVCRIPVRVLCPDSHSNSVYAEVVEMTRKMATRALHIEVLAPDGGRVKEPNRLNRPLMARCDYLKSEGVVEARFNDEIAPYLLELRKSYTQAQVSQLLLIRSAAAHRIYWLVREYAQQGRRERRIEVDELRHLLGLNEQYAGRFDHFKARVLLRAQQELAGTDLPITLELERAGKMVKAIVFRFPAIEPARESKPEPPAPTSWQALLTEAGVAARSLATVQAHLAAGDYDEGYVRFVLATMREQVASGKVKRLAGAVFKALTERYLLPDYQQRQARPAPAAPARESAAARRAREKKLAQLYDLRTSLRFVEHEAPELLYPGPQRQLTMATIRQEISRLEAELAEQTP